MSKQTIETFFPAFTKFLTTQVPNGSWAFHDLLFPDAAADACPEISIQVPSFQTAEDNVTIRQPILLLAAIGGTVIGFYGAIRLSFVSYKWVMSYAAFAIMNVVAIWMHCLLEAPYRLYAEDYPLLWMVDTYMTGVAASALAVACWETYYSCRDKELKTNRSTENQGWDVIFWSVQGLGVVALAGFIRNYNFWVLHLVGLSFLSALWLNAGKGRISVDPPSMEEMGVTHGLELWYLVPPLIATIAATQLLFGPIVAIKSTSQRFTLYPEWNKGGRDPAARSWTTAHGLFAISLILPAIVGIGLDRFWCWAIHSRESGGTFVFFLWDLFTASTMTFLGCDLAYLGTLLWLRKNIIKTPT